MKNKDGDTPLHLAAANGKLSAVRALLEHADINVNAENHYAITPLHLAALNNQGYVVRVLLSNVNVNVNAADRAGNTPIHIATIRGQLNAVGALLVHPNININAVSQDGNTPLHLAVLKENNANVVSALLKHRGMRIDTINAVNQYGQTPLHMAAFTGNVRLVELLLINGADFTKKNAQGITPLELAQREHKTECAEFLKNWCDTHPVFTLAKKPRKS